VKSNQGGWIAPGLAGDLRIGQRNKQAIAHGSDGRVGGSSRVVCQSPMIVADEIPMRL
jgi:hypothetical protein